jgi:hypothetical protein
MAQIASLIWLIIGVPLAVVTRVAIPPAIWLDGCRPRVADDAGGARNSVPVVRDLCGAGDRQPGHSPAPGLHTSRSSPSRPRP